MADLNSLTSLQTLVTTLAGKHENAAVKQDLALVGTAVSLLAQTLVPRLDPSLNLAGIDAGLAKAFDGITDTVTAIEAKVTTEAGTNADPSTTQTEVSANA
ncbi:hypothetical protein HKD24_11305 [Gluconobacter sp. LMG 31484]|uniref:Uncharacterized protein n=1 Tax=Gluconobacter vitians TaxID=2728102 RepID=A0ABR9Y781_9PROT|nr:hypothetical protein [Gluconobacter vitians]MBF0859800.1 hypothetical protein [Gluconobacter vitians]